MTASLFTKLIRTSTVLVLSSLLVLSSAAADAKPLRALLITGGCCHDYNAQKDILKKGLEARANVVVEQIHSPDGSTAPPLPIYGNPDYAKGYDVVIHDECATTVNNPATIAGVLAPHRKGIPGVNLHCGVHSYRIGNPGEPAKAGEERSAWFDYLGLQSSGHGPQQPIAISYVNKDHAITRGLPNWTTINEELYNNVQLFPTATPLARGSQGFFQGSVVVTWVNDYKGTRVFSTTLGHNNETVADARYLDLVTRGLLWACGKLDDNGKPKEGYGPKK
jgi:hypothetical protein